jgi:hypothetical protein
MRQNGKLALGAAGMPEHLDKLCYASSTSISSPTLLTFCPARRPVAILPEVDAPYSSASNGSVFWNASASAKFPGTE